MLTVIPAIVSDDNTFDIVGPDATLLASTCGSVTAGSTDYITTLAVDVAQEITSCNLTSTADGSVVSTLSVETLTERSNGFIFWPNFVVEHTELSVTVFTKVAFDLPLRSRALYDY